MMLYFIHTRYNKKNFKTKQAVKHCQKFELLVVIKSVKLDKQGNNCAEELEQIIWATCFLLYRPELETAANVLTDKNESISINRHD